MTAALVEEATRRSAVVWLQVPGARARPAWHVWHAGSAYVVTGGLEQPLPEVVPGTGVLVVVRSRERQGDRVVQWQADVEAVAPGTPLWDEVVPLMHAARLNPPDRDEQPARWARECRVLRLVPTGETVPVGRG